jgi:hypothetical protein
MKAWQLVKDTFKERYGEACYIDQCAKYSRIEFHELDLQTMLEPQRKAFEINGVPTLSI